MNNNGKIVVKLLIVGSLIYSIPCMRVYGETAQLTPSIKSVTAQSKKSIYIYNTHQSEKYASSSVIEGSLYLQKLLQSKGYNVDYEKHDFEEYKDTHHIDYALSYNVSKIYAKKQLNTHGAYDLVIDFHRDSVKKSITTLEHLGVNYAKVMFVVGKGSTHYKDVLKSCQKLSGIVNKKIDGLSRGIYLKESHYNQGLTENMMLIEVGANENTFEEVQNTLKVLSESIVEYFNED